MEAHQKDQYDGFCLTQRALAALGPQALMSLQRLVADYRAFREDTSAFLHTHFFGVCTSACYQSRLSACCTRDGIIVYFADVVVNTLAAPAQRTHSIIARLAHSHQGTKCIYLGEQGCLWTVKPIGCEMFLCDQAQHLVFSENPDLRGRWETLNTRRKSFTWPDRPVLFDLLETRLMALGIDSSLMYFHKSPGLLRVKRQAGLI